MSLTSAGARRAGSLRRRRAFTLIEMMVVITIIAILIGIAVPVIGRARESARDVQCKSNLRQIGQGLTQYATRMGRFCSGAWDWKRDGAVHEVGWVADLVIQGIPVGDLVCPTNDARLSRVYHELLTMDPSSNTCADSIGGSDRTLPDGTVMPNPCRQLSSPTGDKARIVTELFYKKKFNTNYTASWFLVRGEVELDARGDLKNKSPGCATGTREKGCTQGPLQQARIGGKNVPSNTVPIMACGGLSVVGENMLNVQIDEHLPGTFLSESYTPGPRDRQTFATPVGNSAASGNAKWWGPWNAALQDYRAFGVVHGGTPGGSCNILFLDGSVGSFVDTNNDGQLNNGFPASPASGFADDLVELPPTQVFSQWSMDVLRLPN